MAIKLNLLRDMKLRSFSKKAGKLTLGAKFFLSTTALVAMSVVYLTGSDSLKTLNAAEKYKLHEPPRTVEISVPKAGAANVLDGAANSSSNVAKLKVSFEEIDLSKGFILDDAENKISSDFQIPEGKEKSVAFWFDLYTKYTEDQIVIYNKKYPWLIYDVVSTKEIKHELTQEELKFRIDKIKYTVKEMVEGFDKNNHEDKSKLETQEQMHLYSLYEDAFSFEIERVKDSVKYIDYTYGLKNSFVDKIIYYSKFMKTIEFIFSKNKVNLEWTRLFLISPLLKNKPYLKKNFLTRSDLQKNLVPLINKSVNEKFLTLSSSINENLSPIKVAQILSVLIKNLDEVETEKSILNKEWLTFDGDVEAAFLAALHADEYFRELFTDIKQSDTLPIKAYRLKEDTELKQLVKLSGMQPSKFFEINPDILLNNYYQQLYPDTVVALNSKSSKLGRKLSGVLKIKKDEIFLSPNYTFFVY